CLCASPSFGIYSLSSTLQAVTFSLYSQSSHPLQASNSSTSTLQATTAKFPWTLPPKVHRTR
ncbi:hypothetical protein SESBI_18077, partial [Sesbania bispinosa]